MSFPSFALHEVIRSYFWILTDDRGSRQRLRNYQTSGIITVESNNSDTVQGESNGSAQ
jgi:hypothetical protein